MNLFIIPLIGVIVSGVFIFVLFQIFLKRLRMVHETILGSPLTQIGENSRGYKKIKCRVFSNNSINSPYSGQDCVFWELAFFESRETLEAIVRFNSNSSFEVVCGLKTLNVNPLASADFGSPSFEKEFLISEISAELKKLGKSHLKRYFQAQQNVVLREYTIKQNEELDLCGNLVSRSSGSIDCKSEPFMPVIFNPTVEAAKQYLKKSKALSLRGWIILIFDLMVAAVIVQILMFSG
ncbi:MAG: hypothetical protein NZT61_04990 [Deltaproteobacteria bacterium]|nr:hypothetical protein [Deltaproteobacteria bacterium]